MSEISGDQRREKRFQIFFPFWFFLFVQNKKKKNCRECSVTWRMRLTKWNREFFFFYLSLKKKRFFFNIGGDGCVNKKKMGILKSARRSPVERDNPFLCVCASFTHFLSLNSTIASQSRVIAFRFSRQTRYEN